MAQDIDKFTVIRVYKSNANDLRDYKIISNESLANVLRDMICFVNSNEFKKWRIEKIKEL